jgi:hypothetical protein
MYIYVYYYVWYMEVIAKIHVVILVRSGGRSNGYSSDDVPVLKYPSSPDVLVPGTCHWSCVFVINIHNIYFHFLVYILYSSYNIYK